MTSAELATKLRQIRKQARLSQAGLSKKMGRSDSWVARVESGRIGIQIDDIALWADACKRRMELNFPDPIFSGNMPAIRIEVNAGKITKAQAKRFESVNAIIETFSRFLAASVMEVLNMPDGKPVRIRPAIVMELPEEE